MKKGRFKFIEIDMFPHGLALFLSNRNVEEYEKTLTKYIKVKKEDMVRWKEIFQDNNDANGFVAMRQELGGVWQIIVFTDKAEWKNTLVHEALHAVERLCEYRSIPISQDTEELRAMLLGEIVKKCEL